MSLDIKVDDDYRITSDPFNLILLKSHKSKKGEIKWEPVGYYGRMDYLCEGLVAHKVYESNNSTMQELISTLRGLYAVCDGVGNHLELLRVPKS